MLKRMMRNQSGFSLVELMVVVAIIGVLAAIAIPNVNRYIAKSRQSEAKANLSALYGAEKTFFTEYNLFYHDFRVIGFTPEGQLRYNVSFSAVGTPVFADLQQRGYTGGAVAGNIIQTGAGGAAPAATARCGRYDPTQPNSGFVLGCAYLADAGPISTNAAHIVGGVAPNLGTIFTANACGRVNTNSAVASVNGCTAGMDNWTVDNNKVFLNAMDGTQ